MKQPALGHQPILEVTDLVVEFAGRREPLVPVRGVSFTVNRSERLAIVGESGSGKSLTALALMRLLPPGARIGGGSVVLDGTDIVSLRERDMAGIRGGRLALIYQDPMSSLNPLQSVGRQIVEAIRTHEDVSRRTARVRAIELLGEVGLPQPAKRFDSYPHQFSGGMRQRVMIAMAIAATPDVLIADEPTTALDVTTQARIIELLGRLVEQRDMSVILITHDLGIAASFCDDVHVMYAGRIVERSSATALFTRPVHPYTEALLSSVCRLDIDVTQPISAIAGQPPLPQQLPTGCSFHPRCPHAVARCRDEVPGLQVLEDGRSAECHFAALRAGAVVA